MSLRLTQAVPGMLGASGLEPAGRLTEGKPLKSLLFWRPWDSVLDPPATCLCDLEGSQVAYKQQGFGCLNELESRVKEQMNDTAVHLLYY